MSRSIPSDLQEEIITRLPVESLIRCRSVCKAWKSLIDSSAFIAAHSVRQTQPQHFLMMYQVREREENEGKYVSFVDDNTFPQQRFDPIVPVLVQILKVKATGSRIVGSSHGLLCLHGYYYREQEKEVAVLWNPSIIKSIAVAVPFSVLSSSFSRVLGFGVCPNTCDPTLVAITSISAWWRIESISYIPRQVMVFSLSSKEWRSLRNNLPRKSIGFTWSQVAIGHFIYWFAYDRIAEDGGIRDHNLIMSFDLSTEEFREVNLPDSSSQLRSIGFSISRLRESLALLESAEDMNGMQVCIVWMMEHGDTNTFTKLYTINPPYPAYIQRILWFRKSGDPIFEMTLYYCHQKLAVYEPFSEHFKDLGIFVNGFSSYVNSYTESLLLLNEEDHTIY